MRSRIRLTFRCGGAQWLLRPILVWWDKEETVFEISGQDHKNGLRVGYEYRECGAFIRIRKTVQVTPKIAQNAENSYLPPGYNRSSRLPKSGFRA